MEKLDLSIEGKIHIIKSLGISPLLYAIEMKEINTSYVKRIMDILWSFLWNGKVKCIEKKFVYCLDLWWHRNGRHSHLNQSKKNSADLKKFEG